MELIYLHYSLGECSSGVLACLKEEEQETCVFFEALFSALHGEALKQRHGFYQVYGQATTQGRLVCTLKALLVCFS